MEEIIGGNGTGGPDPVTEAGDADFAEAVIQGSQETPVIVDFWAPWCEPCKQMTPLLEKAVRAAKGAVKLVKVNIDENPAVAQQLQIQSIPAVLAFHQGQPVDGFMGQVPESQISSFVSKLAQKGGGTPGQELLEIGREALKSGDLNRAAQAFSQAMQEDPSNPEVAAGLARCFVEAGEPAQAKAVLDQLPTEAQEHDEVQRVKSAIALKEKADQAAGQIESLQETVAADPDDHQARIDLAEALAAMDRREEAVDQLLESMKRDRSWNDEAARKALLDLFEAFGPSDPATVAGRRKLSSLLFA